MGQKVNPISFRMGVEKDWSSKWFDTRNFSKFLLEDIYIREEIEKKLTRNASIKRIEIKRDAREVVVIIYTSKPGMIIGRSGQGINDLAKFLESKVAKHRQVLKPWEKSLDLKNINKKIKIEIVEVNNPELCARLMAQNIASQLEKRIAFRRAAKQAMTRIMQNRQALGVKVVVAGRLGGAEIARTERFSEGSIPLNTIKSNVDYALETAYTTYGTIGVKVWICQKEIAKNSQSVKNFKKV
ncbi:MAG: 30S ribosomal protein S3 [Patescibacteria group bacterium]|nr:30S ribosomal protein S3 [Patescibacteria group bacterium]